MPSAPTAPIDPVNNESAGLPDSKAESDHFEVTANGPDRHSYLKTLAPWSKYDKDARFFTTMLMPFTYFFIPAVFWVITSFGIYIGLGALAFNYTFPIKIVAPPYNWDPVCSTSLL